MRKTFWQLKNRKRVKLTRNLIRGLEIFKLSKPWPYKTPMPGTEQQETWPGGALEDPDPKCDGCKRNRLTGARCSGSQSNRGWTGSVCGRVCTSVFLFWTGSRLSHASSLASWGHGHQRTQRCWRWRISLIKDSINILQLSGKGLVARWPAIWRASTPGFVIFSEKAGA